MAILIMLMMMPVTYAAVACNGWSTSPAERMACCQAAAGHCAAVSADTCCADGEQRQNFERVTAILVSPGSMVSERVPTVARTRLTAPDRRITTGRPDTYLLDSVFLI